MALKGANERGRLKHTTRKGAKVLQVCTIPFDTADTGCFVTIHASCNIWSRHGGSLFSTFIQVCTP